MPGYSSAGLPAPRMPIRPYDIPHSSMPDQNKVKDVFMVQQMEQELNYINQLKIKNLDRLIVSS